MIIAATVGLWGELTRAGADHAARLLDSFEIDAGAAQSHAATELVIVSDRKQPGRSPARVDGAGPNDDPEAASWRYVGVPQAVSLARMRCQMSEAATLSQSSWLTDGDSPITIRVNAQPVASTAQTRKG